MKSFLFCFTTLLISIPSFAALRISCTGLDENGKNLFLSAYPLNNGTPDYVVTLRDSQGLEYNYTGSLSLNPRPGVRLWVYGRGLNLIVNSRIEEENFSRGTISADHTHETYALHCLL